MQHKVNVGSMASIVIDNELIFSDFRVPALFSLNLGTNKVTLLSIFENENHVEYLHINMERFRDTIVIFPLSDNGIILYNINSTDIEKFYIPKEYESKEYRKGILIGNYACFFNRFGRLICFDLVKKEFLKSLEETSLVSGGLICNSINQYKEGISYVISDAGTTREFVLKQNVFGGLKDIKQLDYKIGGMIDSVYFFDELLWITFLDRTDIVSWDGKNTYITYTNNELSYIDKKNRLPYSQMASLNDELYVSGYYSNCCYKIDKKTRRIIKLFDDTEGVSVTNIIEYGPCYNNIHKLNSQTIVFFPCRSNKVVFYNPAQGKADLKDVGYAEKEYITILEQIREQKTFSTVKESEIYDLSNFIKDV